MSPITILVVEDDGILNQVLVTSLEFQGYTVASAACGEEALAKIAAARFDAVITDYRLGDVDGLAVIRACKAKDPRTMALMITGVAEPEVKEQALAAGAEAFFYKPLAVKTLLQHLPPP